MEALVFAIYALFFIAGCDSGSAIDSHGHSFLALGDSYTIGESVDASKRWPNMLADSLRAAGVKIQNPRILAKTGWTTDELTVEIGDSNITRSYDLVSLLIGVNNQYRGLSVEQFRKEFKALLDNAVLLAGDKTQTDISMQAAEDSTLIADDGLHPSGRMYSLWVHRIMPLIYPRIKDLESER